MKKNVLIGIAIYGYMTLIVITNEISFEIENIIVVGSLISLTGFLMIELI